MQSAVKKINKYTDNMLLTYCYNCLGVLVYTLVKSIFKNSPNLKVIARKGLLYSIQIYVPCSAIPIGLGILSKPTTAPKESANFDFENGGFR